MPRSKIARSYSSFIFNFLRNFYTVFHSGHTNFHFHQVCTRVPFFPHSYQHLFLLFLITAVLTKERCYLVVLIRISQMINDVQQLFMYLLAICMSSVEKYVFRFLPIFNQIVFLLLSCMGS